MTREEKFAAAISEVERQRLDSLFDAITNAPDSVLAKELYENVLILVFMIGRVSAMAEIKEDLDHGRIS